MANDATFAWNASPSAGVTSYAVTWTYNGTALPVQGVPQTSAQDSAGYTLDFNSANPTITLKGGDVIGASVVAIDATTGLSSTADVANPVTEPTTPVAPQPPQNATLTLA